MVHEFKQQVQIVKAGKPSVLNTIKKVSRKTKQDDVTIHYPRGYIQTLFESKVPTLICIEVPIDDNGKPFDQIYHIQYTKQNLDTYNKFIKYLEKWKKDTYTIKLSVTIYNYQYTEKKKTIDGGIPAIQFSVVLLNRAGAKVGKRKPLEICSVPQNFYFFNTYKNKFYDDVTLLDLPDFTPRFPKSIKWAKSPQAEERFKLAYPRWTTRTILKRACEFYEKGIDAPLPLQWSKLDFFIEDLKHYTAIKYGKMPTLKSLPDNKNVAKSLCIIIYQLFAKTAEVMDKHCTTKWDPNTFSFAKFHFLQAGRFFVCIPKILEWADKLFCDPKLEYDMELFTTKYGTKSKELFTYENMLRQFLVTVAYCVLFANFKLLAKECKVMLKHMNKSLATFKGTTLYKLATDFSDLKVLFASDYDIMEELIKLEKEKRPKYVEVAK